MKRVKFVCLKMLLLLGVIVSCSSVPLDPSPSALASGDYTVMQSACTTGMAQGLDVCRVVDGAPIHEVWKLVIPYKDGIVSGELRIRYRDRVLTWPVTTQVVSIPWREVVGAEVWSKDLSSPVQVLGTVKVKTGTGDKFVDALGMAFLIVLAKGYSPMPIDSGVEAWKTECRIQYSSAGRSAIDCK